MLVYLNCSSSLEEWYPKTPNDTKMNWAQPDDKRYVNSTNGWQLLNVQADGPVRFGYAVVAGIAPDPFPNTAFTKQPQAGRRPCPRGRPGSWSRP